MILNWPIAVLAVFILFPMGIISVCSPIMIAKLTMRNPDPNAFPDEMLRPKVREALRLIKEDPDEYARRFSDQMDFIRLSGCVALFIAAFILMSMWQSLSR